MAVEGKNIAAVDDAGGGLGLAGNIVPLPGQQLVGTLDAEIAHAVGVLHDHGIYRAGVQGIDRFDVGVECNHPEVLGTAKVRDSLRGTDTDGFVKGNQHIDLRMAGQHGQSFGAGAFGGGHAVDSGGNLGTAAVCEGINDAFFAFLRVGTVDIVADKADMQWAFDVFKRRLGSHLPGTVVIGPDVGGYFGGIDCRIYDDDAYALIGSGVDGGSVLLVVGCRKDDSLCPVLNSLFNQVVLGGVVLLAFRAGDGQIHVVLGRSGLGSGKDRAPELGAGGFGNQRNAVARCGGRGGSGTGAACQQQRRQQAGERLSVF